MCSACFARYSSPLAIMPSADAAHSNWADWKACLLIAKDDALIASDPTAARRRDMDDSGRFRRNKLPFLPA